MSNVQIDFTLPTVKPSQAPIAYVRIDGRVDPSLPWTELNRVVPPGTSLLLEQVAPGQWFYRGVVVDNQGQESPNPLEAQVVIPFDVPSDLTTFTATLV